MRLNNYDDYQLNLLVEAILNKDCPLYFSDRFYHLIDKINHPISDELIKNNQKEGFKFSYIDLDDSGLDKISFITSTKASEVIADYKGKDKEKDINITNLEFNNARYDYDLKDKLYTKFRSVTTIGKLINKLFPGKFEAGGKPGQDIQSFVDKFKSNRDIKDLELVNGNDIVKWYYEKKYIDGNDTEGSLGGSCMRYEECQDYIKFYAENQDVVSLLILKVKNNRGYYRIKGRALVWKLSYPVDRIFMDRIYTTDNYDEELFKSYAKKEGWLYKFRQNSSDSEYIVDSRDDSKNKISLTVDNVNESSTDQYPYMDTLKYYSVDDEQLSSDSNFFNGDYYSLESTDGDRDLQDSNRIWVEYYEEYFDEDDIVFCEKGDEYRTHDDAIYSEYYGEYITQEYLDNNMQECEYSDGYGYEKYRDSGDYYETADGEYACVEYARNNMMYSEYSNEWIPPNEDVYSEHHQDYLYEKNAVEVYLDEAQRKKDWRAEDDDTWFEWDWDSEKYDNDVSIEDLKEYNDLNDEDEKDE